MRVLLDLQALQSESRDRGIGRYTRGLVGAMLRNSEFADIAALINTALPKGFEKTQPLSDRREAVRNPYADLEGLMDWLFAQRQPVPLHRFHGLTDVAGIFAPSDNQLAASEVIYDSFVKTCSVDIVHQQSAFDGFGDNTVIGSSGRATGGPARAITVYDLIPFEDPDLHLADPNRRRWYTRRLKTLESADLLLTISEFTRQAVLRRLTVRPEQVVTIGTDADPIFKKQDLAPATREDLLRKYGLRKPFLLHVGILEERKNVSALIQAVGLLPQEIRSACQILLVADTTEPQQQSLISVAQKCGIEPSSLVFPGFVPDRDLAALYSLSTALVMPSFAEGFGLPVLEAMRCGTSVVAANSSSLPEVVGCPELLFDPRAPSELARILHQLLTDESFRRFAKEHSQNQEKVFSWQRSTTTAFQAYQDAVSRRRREQPHQTSSGTKYVLVQPLCPTPADAALAEAVGERLKAYEGSAHFRSIDLLSADQSTSGRASTIAPSSGERLLILSAKGHLDLRQQALLARMPAALITSSNELPKRSREIDYLANGYSSLLRRTALQADQSAIPLPQIAAVLSLRDDLVEKLERSFRDHCSSAVLETLANIPSLNARARGEVAAALFANHRPAPPKPRLFVDVSELKRNDAKSGIQRVVRNIVRELLVADCAYRVEPVFRDDGIYRYAREFTCKFLKTDSLALPDALVDLHPSDIFLGLDLDLLLNETAANFLRAFRLAGGKVSFVVYDLLPLKKSGWFRPEFGQLFPTWLERIASASNQLIAISQSVANELADYLASTSASRGRLPRISWYHNGADLDANAQGFSFLSPEERRDIEALFKTPTAPLFLTVGTVEPRKGVSQLIEAAEHIWRTQDARFIIVGKQGWLVDDLADKIRNHPENGTRLFWFEQTSDHILDLLYKAVSAVVMPSEAEGFGLPLVEAARHGTPIIARDLSVFREIAGDSAFYFTGSKGEDLGAALLNWIQLRSTASLPDSKAIKVLNWTDSKNQLLAALFNS